MHMNGTTESFAKLGEVAVLTGKRPASWSTALENCRRARGWTHKQLIAEALKGESVTLASVKGWELARGLPTLNQCHKLRAALPALGQFDDLLRLELRADTKAKAKAPPVPVKKDGWPGPPVKSFSEALKWCRMNHGMSQADLSRIVGVVSMASWEREGVVMIRGTYEILCDELPELRFAPLPKFSAKYQNQFRSRGFMESQEAHRDVARAQELVAPPAPPQAQREPDRAPLNSAGANYGVLRAEVIGLEAELERMDSRHNEEKRVLMNSIDAAKAKVKEAEEHMMSAAKTMHSRLP